MRYNEEQYPYVVRRTEEYELFDTFLERFMTSGFSEGQAFELARRSVQMKHDKIEEGKKAGFL